MMTEWNPWGDMFKMQKMDMMNPMMSPMMSMRDPSSMMRWTPLCDIKETDKCFCVKAELPGMKKEDLNIEMNDNMLTISGERASEKKEDTEQWHCIERCYGKFSRSIKLPKNVDEKNIQAKFENGMLELTVPKTPEKPKSTKITVR